MKKQKQSEIFLKQINEKMEKSYLFLPDPLHNAQLDIMVDEDVQELLKISNRTLRRLRKSGKLSYMLIGKRFYYIRQMLYRELLKNYNDT